MRNIRGNLFKCIGSADVICITTNGVIKSNGEAVMGRGCALTAKQRYSKLPIILGSSIHVHGNHASYLITDENTEIWSFPVKHKWFEEADLQLIKRSSIEMMNVANNHPLWSSIVIPRPGCGNGKLSYSDVEPILQSILDDRFYIITF